MSKENTQDTQLDMEILKTSLTGDDFGIIETKDQRIDSIADLDKPKADKKDESDEDTDKDGKNKNKPQEQPDVLFKKDEDLPDNTDNDDQHFEVGKEDPKITAILKAFGDNLKQTNILPTFNEEEFNKAEDKDAYFQKAFEDHKNKAIEEAVEEKVRTYKSELPAEIDELIKLHKEGVPLYALLEADQRIASLDNIKTSTIEEDIQLQKDIVSEHLNSQGYNQERIDAKIKRYEDLGTLKDEALESFDALKIVEKREKDEMIKAEKQKKLDAERKRDLAIQDLTNKVNSKTEILKGFPLKPEDKKIIIDGLTKIAGVDKQGRPYTSLGKAASEDPDHALKVAYLTLILKGDLSTVAAKAQTQATRKLRDAIDSSDKTSSSNGSSSTSSNSNGVRYSKDVAKAAIRALRRE